LDVERNGSIIAAMSSTLFIAYTWSC
jgi:hypothetical protein